MASSASAAAVSRPPSTTWPPVSAAVSASKPSNRRRDRPRTGQIPVRARPAKPAVAATWHHRGMSDALPAGSTLADAVAMPPVDGASRAVLVGLSGGLDYVVLLHLLCPRAQSRHPETRPGGAEWC